MDPALHRKYNIDPSTRPIQLIFKSVWMFLKDHHLQYFHSHHCSNQRNPLSSHSKTGNVQLYNLAQALSAPRIFLLTSSAKVPSFVFKPNWNLHTSGSFPKPTGCVCMSISTHMLPMWAATSVLVHVSKSSLLNLKSQRPSSSLPPLIHV